MKKWIVAGLLMVLTGGLYAADCSSRFAELGLPHKLKMGKKPVRARWAPVERALTDLREGLQGTSCEVRFNDVFEARQPDFFFPLLGNLLRTVPEESLVGAGVYSQDGSRLGEFSNRVPYERNGNVTWYFQFKDRSDRLQSSGNQLIDIESRRPIFQLKWSEILDRILFAGQSETDR